VVSRQCPNCGAIWHSADSGGVWVCQECGAEIGAWVGPVQCFVGAIWWEWVAEIEGVVRGADAFQRMHGRVRWYRHGR